jgi:hypothetical protein
VTGWPSNDQITRLYYGHLKTNVIIYWLDNLRSTLWNTHMPGQGGTRPTVIQQSSRAIWVAIAVRCLAKCAKMTQPVTTDICEYVMKPLVQTISKFLCLLRLMLTTEAQRSTSPSVTFGRSLPCNTALYLSISTESSLLPAAHCLRGRGVIRVLTTTPDGRSTPTLHSPVHLLNQTVTTQRLYRPPRASA